MEAVRCRCGSSNEPAQRFCGACGAALSSLCPACGAASPAAYRFCGNCGGALGGTATGTPAERLTEERRWVTVLFADLSGFTSLSERMDPEDVRALVDRCMALMAEVVAHYGGTVEGVVGDQLLALFGAPVTHEDDPERAVRTALDLQRCAVEHADAFGGLPLRIGVNTGEVMFAPVGPEGARHQTVMGDVANTASRLQTAAPVAGILVGQETYGATRRAFRYEAVAPFAAKGKEAPIAAWQPLEALGGASRRPASTAPIVGRDAELEMLWRIWERVVAERRPHLVTVLGPPGIGKTRLARELIVRAEAAGARCLAGRSLPYGERTGYGAFAEQVKGLAGIFDTEPLPEVRAKLATACGVLAEAEAGPVASHLAVLLGLGPDEIVPEKAALLFSARRFVEAVAEQTPTVFVFEDVHWSDPTLLELIESLASRCRRSPMLLLTLARPELLDLRPTWGGGLSRYTVLALDPLPPAAGQVLAARLAPNVTEIVTARLGEVAGGNPLFIEELAASLSDTTVELLTDLPTNVKATIAARLDALPPGERHAVLDASVVGKIFWHGALQRQGNGRDLVEILDSLERRDFIRREPTSRFEGDIEFSFKHMLIREVAYATLPKAARRERHAAVARFLEDAGGDRLAESASLLAHHWLEAGDAVRARDYLVQAAERARRAWASAEAVRLYDEALRLVSPDDAETRGRLRSARAFALFDAGDLAAVATELDGLLPELGGEQRAEALFLRAQSAFWLADYAGVGRLGEELAGLAAELNQPAYERLSDLALSEHRMLSGSLDESMTLGERALRSWPATERPAERALALGTIGLVAYWAGAFARSVDANDSGWRLGREVDSVTSFLYTGPQLGLALAGLGRHEEAVAHLEWVLAEGRELELVPRLTGRCLGMFSGVLYEIQQNDRARRMSEEAIECSRRASFPNARIMAKVDLLRSDMDSGEFGRAEVGWPALWDEAGDLKGWHEWLARGRLLVARADLLLALGAPEEAATAATTALAHWREHRRPKYEAAARAALGRAQMALGRRADGIAELRGAVEIAERLGHPPTLWRTAAQLATALAAVGDDTAAATAHALVAATIECFAAGLSEILRTEFLAAEQTLSALDTDR